ncbi:MAG: pectate lyase [Candidatus Accumulibacter sp.]|jgi:hypothetical protein|nr:pectate lyase [Accumulibacter sp.]
MKRRTFLGSSILVPIAMTTAACGGGGGGGDDAPPVVDPTQPIDPDPVRAAAKDAMRRAVTYMDENVSYRGGYVWNYLDSDRTQCWGEMQAYPTMCWMQSATPQVGDAILDAYHATGDETFYKAAEHTALALVEAQHPAGGWNYIYDFAGEDSLKRWYETIGINGWRLEEFQHYYGNATFDDATTANASQFMLRMYLEKQDPRFKASLDKAIAFVLDSQFKTGIAAGGWSQRFPRAYNATQAMPAPNWPPTGPNWTHLQAGNQNGDFLSHGPGGLGIGYTGIFCGMEDRDYTNFVTFNDDVITENIKFLMLCVLGLGDMSLKASAVAAMDCVHRIMYRYDPAVDGATVTRFGEVIPCVKQAGWGLQHLSADTLDAYGVLRPAGAPAGARGYESRGLCPAVTAANIDLLFDYFRLTGDKKYLYGLEDALDWLDSCPLRNDQRSITSSRPDGDPESILGNTHPRVVELGTNRPRFPHRYGTNIWNGAYYFDYDWRNTPSHYGASANAATGGRRTTLDRLKNLPNVDIAAMVANSPLNVTGKRALPRYFSVGGEVNFSHLWENAVKGSPARTEEQTNTTVSDLGDRNYWVATITNYTNPYTRNGDSTPYLGKEYMSRHVGDITDTSPYSSAAAQMPAMPPYTDAPKPVQTGINTTGQGGSPSFISQLNNLTAFIEPITAVSDPTYKS